MQNCSDRTDSISSVGDYPTLRFGAGPVKGHCPKVSTGPKIDQQVSRHCSENRTSENHQSIPMRGAEASTWLGRIRWIGSVRSRRNPPISVTDRLLYPEFVHLDERIRIVGLKARPVTQIGAGRVVGKTCAVLMKHLGIQLEADELEP
jgi:hypothetical protein